MSDTPNDILVHTEAGVTTITLNRVDKKNSLTRAMYATLADTFEAAAQGTEVRVVVLQGDLAIFSAGNDIGDFLQQPPATQDSPVFRFLRGIATFPKPVIASVCGPAVGIGTTMLFHCDLVYAGDNAAFSMPFVNLGLCPEAASSLLVPQMLGYHRAAEALLLGEPFMAEAALEVGLVNRVVSSDDLDAASLDLATKIARNAPIAVRESLQLARSADSVDETGLWLANDAATLRVVTSDDAREGPRAFMERREPRWSGT